MLSQSYRLPFFVTGLTVDPKAVQSCFSIPDESGLRWVYVYMNGYEGDSPQPVVVFDKIEDAAGEGVISIHEDIKTALQHINETHIHFLGYPGTEFLSYCMQKSYLVTEEVERLQALLDK